MRIRRFKTRAFVSTLALLIVLSASAWCEQLYIRNRPFKGAVKRSEGRLWVEVKSLSQALGATLIETEGVTTLKMPDTAEAVTLETQQDQDMLWVPLEATAKAIGARLVTNKQMGTIDLSVVKGSSANNVNGMVAKGPVVRQINFNGAYVDITTQLVAGRLNIVEFGADW